MNTPSRSSSVSRVTRRAVGLLRAILLIGTANVGCTSSQSGDANSGTTDGDISLSSPTDASAAESDSSRVTVPTPSDSTNDPHNEQTVTQPESGTPTATTSEETQSDVPPTSTAGTGATNSDGDLPSNDLGMAEGPSTSSSRLRSVPLGTTDATLGFWEYIPPNSAESPAPLLIFTHGAAWQGPGTEESLQELLEVGPPSLIGEDRWPDSRPFIVLSPQNPRSGCFDANDIRDFYAYALATYNVDETRIYHTGQSCGAIGGWNYLAANFNEHVVAAVFISGDGRAAFAQAGCDLGKVAIWGLHNENDGSVPAAGTIEALEALQNCTPTPDVKLTIYPGETAHDAWTKTYDLSAGNDVYSWLLQHQRQ